MRIGVLGGTFDPPHLGHLEFARAAIEGLQLDEVIFVPAHRNPLKKIKSTPAKQRMEMVSLMIKAEAKMSVSDNEISRGGPSYMVETLMELQMVRPGDYWLLMGADALRGIDQWKNPEKLIKLARIGVAIRPPLKEDDILNRLRDDILQRTDVVPMKALEISATELRHRLQIRSGSVAPFLSPAVLQYIKQCHLYGS